MTDGQFLYIVSAVGGAGATAIVAMWRWMLRQVKSLEKRADESDEKHRECQEDRDRLAVRVGELTGDRTLLARCPGAHDGICPNWTPERRAQAIHFREQLAACPIRLQLPDKRGNLPAEDSEP